MPILENLWIIPLLPLLGSAINGLFGAKWSKATVNSVALGSTGVSFLCAVEAVREFLGYYEANHKAWVKPFFDWIVAGNFRAGFDLHPDQLTVVMILVLAANYVLLFVGWEGVGLCSYLLIGFYFLRKSAADAGKKAFIVNRIGDFGFMLGMFLLFRTFHTLDFTALFQAASQPGWGPEGWGQFGTFTVACLLLFMGACGKSAQLPLYVWLPDAMEGPTPVSALIHAATMVTAGVYVVARSHI